ncbi:MAG: hypothetical protein V3U87_09615 [Methylococcaceae bacterium]
MTAPPFELESYFFTRISVNADPLFVYEEEQCDTPEVITDTKVSINNETRRDVQIQLGINVAPSDEKHLPYNIDLIVVGFFACDHDIPEEDAFKKVVVNGTSILYAAARDFLLTVTGRGPFEAYTLPTTSFVDFAKKITLPDEMIETLGEKSKPRKKKAKSN